MAITYVDIMNGDDANDGSTWALAKKTIPNAGDEIRIAKTPDPVSAGQDANFTYKSATVTLTSAVTGTIDQAIGNTWTVSLNVTGGTYNSNRKLGSSMQQLSVATAFTTGKVAYKTIDETDFSAYTKIMLWISFSHLVNYNNSGFRICLCSDTLGETIVNDFLLPVGNIVNKPIPVVLDNVTGLGSSIKSVAIYQNNDASSVALRINNIEACNDIHLKTLIGIGNVMNSKWYGIQSIVGTTIVIEQGNSTNANNMGYDEESGTFPLFIREAISFDSLLQPTTAISYICGYNKTTNEIDGETWLDNSNNSNNSAVIGTLNISIENLCILRSKQWGFNSGEIDIKNVSIIAADGNGFFCNGYTTIDKLTVLNGNGSSAANFNSVRTAKNIRVNCNYGTGGALYIYGSYGYYENIECFNNYWYGFRLEMALNSSNIISARENYLKNVLIKDTGAINMILGYNNVFDNLDFYADRNKSIYMSDMIVKNSRSFSDYNIKSTRKFSNISEFNYDNTVGNFRHWITSTVFMEWQTTVKQGDSSGAWLMNVTNSGFETYSELLRISFPVAEIAVQKDVEVTISVYVYYHTGKGRLVVRPIYSDVVIAEESDTLTETVGWHLLTLTFTPVLTGIAKVEFLPTSTGYSYIAPIAHVI